jgi:hypothetical protein
LVGFGCFFRKFLGFFKSKYVFNTINQKGGVMYQIIAKNLQGRQAVILGIVATVGQAKNSQHYLQQLQPAWVIWVRKIKGGTHA